MGWTAIGRIRLFPRVVVCVVVIGLSAWRADAGQIGFVYALQQVNGGANQIHAFRIDESTGSLVSVAGFPMSSGGNGAVNSHSEQLAFVNGKLFVVNNGSNTLSVFTVNPSTGALTALPYSPVALGNGNWACVAVHQTGSPVVVGDSAGLIASLVVSDVAATPAAGSPFSTGTATPFSCRFAQGGTHVYTGGSVGNTIAGFSINTGTGVLTPLAGSPFDSGAANPLAFASDLSGRLFSAAFVAGQLRVFTTSGGTLTGVTGNPFASGLTGAIHGVLHPGGFYMVADRSAGAVGVYQIVGAGSATTLAAIGGSPFPAGGTFTTALTLTASGSHLVASNGTTRNLTVFAVNPASGALSTVVTQATNTIGTTGTISGLAFAPGEAGFFYTLTQVDSGPNQIYGFRINPNHGGLTALPGFPIATGGTGTFAIAAEQMAYANGRLYVINDGSDTLSAFKVNRATGALTALPFSPMSLPVETQGCVAVHPSGSPVVVGNAVGATNSIDIGATTAAFAPGSPYGFAASYSCRFSQNGDYLYTGGNFGSAIAGFSVDANNGVLTPLAGSPYESDMSSPASYATDSAGRLFTASLNSTSQLRVFTTAAGVPTGVSGNPFGASGLNQPVHGLLHPNGFYITAARNSSNIGVFKINGTGAATTLSAIFGSPFASLGSSTSALALTTNGSYLAAGNGASRNLSVFQVNPSSGNLAQVVLQTANTLGTSGRVTGLVFVPAVAPFIDDPLTALPPLSRLIRASHIAELRARIHSVRAQYGLGEFPYTDALSVATTPVRRVHVVELRDALAEVYAAAGLSAPVYTDPTLTAGVTAVKLAHIQELRAAVLAIE
jgi:6-phosphogluconolactonase